MRWRGASVAVLAITACAAPPIRVLSTSRTLDCPAARRATRFAVGAFLGDRPDDEPSMYDAIDRFAGQAGAPPRIVKLYTSLEGRVGPPTRVGGAIRAILNRHATPMLTLEPTWTRAPHDVLEPIVRGFADSLTRSLARQLRSLVADFPIIIELAPEMNARFDAPWQPHFGSEARDSTEWRQYVAAWRHIVAIFHADGPSNVRWLWAPSAGNPYTHRATGGTHWNWMDHYYPGDDVVDLVGLHAFNDAESQRAWVPFVELVDGDASDRSLSTLMRMHPGKPIMLSEIASSELPGDPRAKAQWIRDLFASAESCGAIAGVVWFDVNKERDWRIESSREALDAFRQGVLSVR